MSLEIIKPTSNPEAVLKEIKASLDFYEAQFSRFKSDSLIARLNAGQKVANTLELESLLRLSKALSSATQGFFNPHVDLATHGYAESFETHNFSASELGKSVPVFPHGLLVHDEEAVQLKPNVALDFGGFLKGYLSQQLVDKYQSTGQGIILNLGGDLSVRGADLNQSAFTIGVYNPVTKSEVPVKLYNHSLSTSGTYKRRWELAGETFHHIIDPSKNQNSDSPLVSVSVSGPSGAHCDAFATALLAMEGAQRESFIKSQPDYDFLMIDQTGQLISTT